MTQSAVEALLGMASEAEAVALVTRTMPQSILFELFELVMQSHDTKLGDAERDIAELLRDKTTHHLPGWSFRVRVFLIRHATLEQLNFTSKQYELRLKSKVTH